MTRPGAPSGKASPDTQTFVSTTTRSARLPHLADGRHHLALDGRLFEAALGGARAAPGQQCVEAPLPFALVDRAHALLGEPPIECVSHEGGDGLTTTLGKRPQARELPILEVDVGALHRLYTIHRTHVAVFLFVNDRPDTPVVRDPRVREVEAMRRRAWRRQP